MRDVQLVTLDPGHFHAALVHKQMLPGLAPRVHVYAPLGPDLLAHLGRVAGFNARAANPTRWELEVHAGPDFLERFVRQKAGNVAVLSGRNHVKIDYLEAAVNAGLHVLADKPWIIRADDLPRLQAVLTAAQRQNLVAYDMMTERYEITTILQRELVGDRDIFGDILPGTAEEPGVTMKSVHYLMKSVAGVPLWRPAWFFDTAVEGEGLTDVGTHLVDLVMWMLFPGEPVMVSDLRLGVARRWPTSLSRDDFQRVTGEADFLPGMLVRDGRFLYYCNTMVAYTLRGIHVALHVLWDFEAPPGAMDTHLAIFRGSRSRIEILQGPEQHYKPELYVVAAPRHQTAVLERVTAKVAQLAQCYAGLTIEDQGERLWVTIPDRYRVGHEAHFAEVTQQFLSYVDDPTGLPVCEQTNMIAKYWLTTHGVELANRI
jgi:predicted dehydrogenase